MFSTPIHKERVVAIDCFPESVASYPESYAIVAIDVIRATTSAVTAAAAGRRCFPVASLQAAFRLAAKMPRALLAGETSGELPAGFHMNNSPARLAARDDLNRPVILLSSSGTRLLHKARRRDAVYLACFRNAASLAARLPAQHSRVVLIGAGSRDEFREEDQVCCAWIARGLMESGYEPLDRRTFEIVRRWGNSRPEAILGGKSVAYLKRSNQLEDLEFILGHINDLDDIFTLRHGEVVTGDIVARPSFPHRASALRPREGILAAF
ncbi:MAG: 2-phosphosulfolactate phosphatase [Terriglobia bacterium]